MARYYRAEHEDAYRRIEREGKSGWDELHGGTGFDDFSSRAFLEEVLPTLGLDPSRTDVFEYGCGTGPGACLLAAQGFRVDAIDLIPRAIRLAKRFAAARGLEVTFAVQDVCALADVPPKKRYDLIVDSYCLQSIVTDADRSRLFAAVQARLKPDGRYLISTAMYDPARRYDDALYDEATGVVLETVDGAERLREAGEAHRARGIGPDEPRVARFVGDVERFREELEERIARVAAGLPRGIVHEDAHAGNLLVDADHRLLALLDFDDARPTFLVADVASLAVWWGVERGNLRLVPAQAAAAVAAYTRHRPLTEDEWGVLPDFMAQYDLLSAIAYVAWRIGTGMAPEQAAEWCDSYARFQEVTAPDDWRAAVRDAIRLSSS